MIDILPGWKTVSGAAMVIGASFLRGMEWLSDEQYIWLMGVGVGLMGYGIRAKQERK